MTSLCCTCTSSLVQNVWSAVPLLILRVLGISWSVILTGAAGICFVCYMLLLQNKPPANLDGYPSRDLIASSIQKKKIRKDHLAKRTPFRTLGRHIVDKHGQRLKLVSVNWYGASDELMIPGGLDIQNRYSIARSIHELGFNSVRLPYADEMVTRNPVIQANQLVANADLIGLRALDVFRAVVESLTETGIAVIINNHITQARWCCDGNLCDAKWENSYLGPFCRVSQTEADWIRNLITVMSPHIRDPLVVGVDLRNEIRGPSGKLLWDSWAAAAEKAAEQLHALQPEWLMIVEGVSSANHISGAKSRPVILSIPDKLVYSAHVYGWSGWGSLTPYWYRNYKSFARDMHHNWAFLLDEDIAPVWIGEFGAPAEPNKGDLHYWKNLIRFLHKSDADFGYWALNPRKPKHNKVESYGLLADDWRTPMFDYRLHDLTNLTPIHSAGEADSPVHPG